MDVRVADDPAQVGGAEDGGGGREVEECFGGVGEPDKVPAEGADYTFGFAGGAWGLIISDTVFSSLCMRIIL